MHPINLSSRSSVAIGLLTLALAGGSCLAWAEEPIPAAFGKTRYDSLREKSPFALATAVAAPASPQASFAANWFVTGVARIGDTNFVTVKSRDLTTQFSLYGDETVDGVMVASVNWSEQIGKSTVVLRKGTETARLEFNEAQLHAPAAPTAAAGPTPPGANPTVAKGPMPGPQPLGVNMAAATNTAPVPNAPGAPRRRVLPIPVPR